MFLEFVPCKKQRIRVAMWLDENRQKLTVCFIKLLNVGSENLHVEIRLISKLCLDRTLLIHFRGNIQNEIDRGKRHPRTD